MGDKVFLMTESVPCPFPVFDREPYKITFIKTESENENLDEVTIDDILNYHKNNFT